MSQVEELFALQCKALKLPAPLREFRFAAPRRWRLDFAWPHLRIGVEIHGGIHAGGRHTRGTGFENDRRKINAALALGWRVYEFSSGMVENGEALALIGDEVRLMPGSGTPDNKAGQ